MGINFFKILKEVMDQSVPSIEKVRFNVLKKVIAKLIDGYRDTYETDYSKFAYRVAYIYEYGAAHANLVYYILRRSHKLLKNIYQKTKKGYLNICSIGGGPGMELLGVMKLIEKFKYRNKPLKKQPLHIDFTVIDKVTEWDEHLYVLIKTIEKKYKKRSINISHHFLSLDLNDEEKIKEFRLRFQDMHIFILNHIISELKEPDKFKKCFKILVKRSSSKSYFIIIDINTQETINTAKEILNGIKKLETICVCQEKIPMSQDEQKTDLKRWFKNTGFNPKLTCNVFYIICQKK